MPTKNYYTILGLPRDATAEQIKLRFRLLSKSVHPDAGGDDEAFKELEEAYRILSDPEERAHYDATGTCRGPEINAARTEMIVCLTEIMGACVSEMRNPDVDDLIKLMRLKIASSMDELQKTCVAAAEFKMKLEKVRARIRKKSGGEDNVLAGILSGKIDNMDMQISRGDIMQRALVASQEALNDYGYDVVQMIASADLTEALRRQDSGMVFYTFGGIGSQ